MTGWWTFWLLAAGFLACVTCVWLLWRSEREIRTTRGQLANAHTTIEQQRHCLDDNRRTINQQATRNAGLRRELDASRVALDNALDENARLATPRPAEPPVTTNLKDATRKRRRELRSYRDALEELYATGRLNVRGGQA
ncbi:MAG TPA: hypothetical protein VFQ42_22055 [Mycobacterium sp.]|nr:hypothetical protein [Mycobacterium sp.]